MDLSEPYAPSSGPYAMRMPLGTGSRAARNLADSADEADAAGCVADPAAWSADSPEEHPAKTIMLRHAPEIALSTNSPLVLAAFLKTLEDAGSKEPSNVAIRGIELIRG
ncbi:hypothetical protein GCM10010176_022550 [Nonomuraea spiralis]|nr:hypothetical protein GCM10010176_022550 [Nonomuraea spiralis]